MKRLMLSVCILLVQQVFGQPGVYDQLIMDYNKKNNFNGVVLVATNGKIDYLKSIGIADRTTGEMMSPQSKFKIASVTKTFTAILILQLYEQGKIDLKVPFGTYYPSYKGDAKNVATIEHLLTYSSAIPDLADKQGMKSYQSPVSIDEYIDKYCSAKPEEQPGLKSNYSNVDYIILHKIIENVTKKSFREVLQENILGPLFMSNTGMLSSVDTKTGLVSSYTIDDSTRLVAPDEPYLIENFFGAGAMYSTAEDLLKLDVGIFTNKLLSRASSKLMITPNKALNNVAFGVWYADGYGVFSKPFIYRTGGILGSCSNWIHTIEDGKSIIVFNNTNGTNLYELSEKLYAISNSQKSQ